jgi:hypothetical protein
MLRSRALSALTRVFHALWRGISKHEGTRRPILRDGANSLVVMPGLGPGIHVLFLCIKDVDGRDKPGHDEWWYQPPQSHRCKSAGQFKPARPSRLA